MKGRQIKYSADEMAWLEDNHLMVISEYHAGFVARFGRNDVSAANLHALRKRRGWKTGRSGCFEKGAVPHNKGKKCTPGTGGCHPNARKTQFKKGNLPHNTKYVGHERISKDGYIEVSIAETNPHTGFHRRYVLKHRHLWEQKHGPIPDGTALKCLDGDKTNCDPSNWEPVDRALLPRLSGRYGRDYENAPDELKPVIMMLSKLELAARRKRSSRSPSL